MSAGYPHISVTVDRRRLAYECCLIHEVITKRIPALDDIRKGLESVKVRGKSSLDLMAKWPEVQTRFFPAPEAKVIDVATLLSCVVYEVDDDDSASQQARIYFEKYLDELCARGCTTFFFSICIILESVCIIPPYSRLGRMEAGSYKHLVEFILQVRSRQ